MEKDKEDDELPLTEYDDVTHWIGRIPKDDGQKTSTTRPTHRKPSEGKGQP